MAIYTDTDLENTFSKVLNEAIQAVGERASKLLQEHINADTYGINKTNTGTPSINQSYLDGTGKPSYEFRDKAWDTSFQHSLTDYLFSLFYDGNLLSPPSPSSQYLHGNYYYGESKKLVDRRKDLADILNVSGFAPDSDMNDTKIREPFWDNFIDELSEKLGDWLDTEFKRRGLTVSGLKGHKFTYSL